LAATDSLRLDAIPPFFSTWNAAQRFRCAAAILRLAAADMLRLGLGAPLTIGAAAPIDLFANRGDYGLDLPAFGFVADQSHSQGGRGGLST
jgi:hypothetical protein